MPLQPACQQYNRLMRDVQNQTYPVLMTALWAIEYAYHEARNLLHGLPMLRVAMPSGDLKRGVMKGWRSNGPMLPPYNEFELRWGSVDFGKSCVFALVATKLVQLLSPAMISAAGRYVATLQQIADAAIQSADQAS